jgi:hypothetical protein
VHSDVCGLLDVTGDGKDDAVAKDPSDTSIADNELWVAPALTSQFDSPYVIDTTTIINNLQGGGGTPESKNCREIKEAAAAMKKGADYFADAAKAAFDNHDWATVERMFGIFDIFHDNAEKLEAAHDMYCT